MRPEAEQLKAKLALWRSWMEQKDQHSITYQIYQMLWEDVTFRVINECRRLAPVDHEGKVQLNGPVHELIDRGYWRSQTLMIRRLCEKNRDRNPDWHVISLRRLLDDIEDDAHLYTRGNIFEAEGLPYDCTEVRKRAEEHRWQEVARWRAEGKLTGFLDSKIMRAAEVPERLHENFDRLSSTTPTTRTPADALRKDLIHGLKARLDVCKGVKTYVDKFIAHTADPANRDAISVKDQRLTFGRIWDCHKAICSTTSFVSVHLLHGPQLHFLAVPQFNAFQHIERPWIGEADIGKLDDVWREQDRQVHEWGSPVWPEGF